MHITHNFEVAAKKFGTLPTGATALCPTAVLLSHDKPQYFARARDSPPHNTPMLSPTLAAPVLNHNPFRSKEHTVTRAALDAGPLATVPRRRSCDPTHPTFRPSGSLALRPFGHRTPRLGWDGPPRRSRSVTARVGDTRGRTERRSGERARAQPGWQRHGGHADAR